MSTSDTGQARARKQSRLALAERIAQQIDWTPTCLPGTERATIVRQVLDLDEIASDTVQAPDVDDLGWHVRNALRIAARLGQPIALDAVQIRALLDIGITPGGTT